MIPFQNRDEIIFALATSWARFARSDYSGASISTIASTVIPANLTNTTNQLESCATLWADLGVEEHP